MIKRLEWILQLWLLIIITHYFSPLQFSQVSIYSQLTLARLKVQYWFGIAALHRAELL